MPLQKPYNGPFEILKHVPNIFKGNVQGKPQNASIDRSKSAFIYLEDSDETSKNNNKPIILLPQPIQEKELSKPLKQPWLATQNM